MSTQKVFIWMEDDGATLITVATTLAEARAVLANGLGRPPWAQLKKWDIGLDWWKKNLLARKPTSILKTGFVGQRTIDVTKYAKRIKRQAPPWSVGSS